MMLQNPGVGNNKLAGREKYEGDMFLKMKRVFTLLHPTHLKDFHCPGVLSTSCKTDYVPNALSCFVVTV